MASRASSAVASPSSAPPRREEAVRRPAEREQMPFGQRPFSQQEQANIAKALHMKLGPEFVSYRPGYGGSGKIAYLEGRTAFALANDTFGFNGWSCSIKNLTIDFMDFDKSGRKYEVGVTACVRVELKDGTHHEDIGYGTAKGVNKSQLLDKAKKQAITDARKRALKTFGNSLGMCLSDKGFLKELNVLRRNVPAAGPGKGAELRTSTYVVHPARANGHGGPVSSPRQPPARPQPPQPPQQPQQPQLQQPSRPTPPRGTTSAATPHRTTSTTPRPSTTAPARGGAATRPPAPGAAAQQQGQAAAPSRKRRQQDDFEDEDLISEEMELMLNSVDGSGSTTHTNNNGTGTGTANGNGNGTTEHVAKRSRGGGAAGTTPAPVPATTATAAAAAATSMEDSEGFDNDDLFEGLF